MFPSLHSGQRSSGFACGRLVTAASLEQRLPTKRASIVMPIVARCIFGTYAAFGHALNGIGASLTLIRVVNTKRAANPERLMAYFLRTKDYQSSKGGCARRHETQQNYRHSPRSCSPVSRFRFQLRSLSPLA
jgi:hypothetical protein